jgi:hypothetical protein
MQTAMQTVLQLDYHVFVGERPPRREAREAHEMRDGNGNGARFIIQIKFRSRCLEASSAAERREARDCQCELVFANSSIQQLTSS